MNLSYTNEPSYFDKLWLDTIIDDIQGDPANESDYSTYSNPDTGDKSYYARVGKKEYSGSVNANSTKGEKALFLAKKVWYRIITAVAEVFKSIGKAIQKVLQVVLIPLSAACSVITRDIPENISMLSKEDRSIIEWVRREGETKIQNPAREKFHDLSKRLDEAFSLSTKSVTLVKNILAKGMAYSLGASEESTLETIIKARDTLTGYFATTKSQVDTLKIQIDDTRREISDRMRSVSSTYYKKNAMVLFTTITKGEIQYMIDKSKNIAKLASQHQDICTKILNSSTGDTGINRVAREYLASAKICNDIVSYFSSFASKFNINAQALKGSTATEK